MTARGAKMTADWKALIVPAGRSLRLSLLRLRQQFSNLGFKDCFIGGAYVARGYAALAVDQESDWQAEGPPVLTRQVGIANRYWIIHFKFLLKGADWFLVVVHGNAENLKTFAGVLALYLDEVRDFLFTGIAPGGPEIKHHDFAAIIRQIEVVTCRQIGQGKIRCGTSG